MKTKKSKKKERSLRYNTGKLEWHNFPLFLLEDLIAVADYGGKKYATFNYLKGAPINEILNSLKRHLCAYESPFESDIDSESQQNHLAHVAWNALFSLYVQKYKPEFDDRYKILKKKKKK